MKIFADNCVHKDVISTLRKAGFKIERAVEKEFASSSDEEIFNYILKTSQILLTFDHDFGNILKFNIRKSQGVVIFRIKNLRKETIAQRVLNFFSRYKEKDLKSRLFIIDVSGRIRRWPSRKI